MSFFEGAENAHLHTPRNAEHQYRIASILRAFGVPLVFRGVQLLSLISFFFKIRQAGDAVLF